MFKFILNKIMGTHNQRVLKRLRPIVDEINSLEPEISRLSDDRLRKKSKGFKEHLNKETKELKQRVFGLRTEVNRVPLNQRDAISFELEKTEKLLLDSQEKILDEILPEAFAVVREAARRTVKMRHYDVQLIGGYVLHKGDIGEMANGEGKTLVATLPAYLNALVGEGVHIVTTNDYLAKRDREWMGPVYEFLGLSVGFIQHDMRPAERKRAYNCDITYGTNNEFGFDYLRDNMVIDKNEMVQRSFHYALVDEVDSILIDEARTPLIISGPAEESTDKYYKINKIIPQLKKGELNEESKEESGDFIVDEKSKNCYLTEAGEIKAAELLGLKSLHEIDTMEYKHHVNQALKAHNALKRDIDYMVKEGKILIVDEFTGRLMPGRRWSDGLHQAVEAKENLQIERENQTLATITFQNYFRMYKKLSGMSGTAATEASEFNHIYKLDVINIPTNKPCTREDVGDLIYRSEKEKFNALCNEVAENYNKGRPVLVGTISIEKSEKLSRILKNRNVPHQVLNAKYHEQEAYIVAQAGKNKSVTIATNMAGRGTDIKLGGNAEYMAEETLRNKDIEPGTESYEEKKKELIDKFEPEVGREEEEVLNLGGLCVLGTERHESRRIDNQLRGRAGRQGVPGVSKFYLSLEDNLLRIFGSDRISNIMDRLGLEEGQVIQHPLVARAIERAQKKVESYNFDIRKHLLEYDDVMNKQRQIIYDQRCTILESQNLKEHILEMLDDILDEKISLYLSKDVYPEDWDFTGLAEWLQAAYGLNIFGLSYQDKRSDEIREIILSELKKIYDEKEQKITPERMRYLEKVIMLQTVDSKWKDHLYVMDDLKQGITLRAYGQRDPLIEYKNEGFRTFSEMIYRIKEEITEFIYKVKPVEEREKRAVFSVIPQQFVHSELGQFSQGALPEARAQGSGGPRERPELPAPRQGRPEAAGRSAPYKRESPKVGRNDPCPCGSGKKYKKCCGR
jgi:preprotein translocase subunit SecA